MAQEKPAKKTMKQVTVNIDSDLVDTLEGYAFGTRQTLSSVIREAVGEYHDKHKKTIERRKV